MRSDIIGADAQHDHSPFLHLAVGVAERTRFGGAAGSVIFWIKVQDNCSATKVRQVYLAVFHNVFAAHGRQRKIRSGGLLLNLGIAHNFLLRYGIGRTSRVMAHARARASLAPTLLRLYFSRTLYRAGARLALALGHI